MNAGKKLREIREKKHLTRYDLSQISGVSESTIAKIELESNKPSAFTLFRLANALEIEEYQIVKLFNEE